MDAELIEDGEYLGFGETAVERVKALLGKLDSVEASKRQGNTVKEIGEKIFHKFVEEIETTFSNLPRPKEWRSFYNNDLPLVTDTDPALREWAIANKLNKSQNS